jgi:hypothetical protein
VELTDRLQKSIVKGIINSVRPIVSNMYPEALAEAIVPAVEHEVRNIVSEVVLKYQVEMLEREQAKTNC